MIEIYGVEVEKKEFELWMNELHKEWETLEDWERECEDNFDKFADVRLHSKVWEEE